MAQPDPCAGVPGCSVSSGAHRDTTAPARFFDPDRHPATSSIVTDDLPTPSLLSPHIPFRNSLSFSKRSQIDGQTGPPRATSASVPNRSVNRGESKYNLRKRLPPSYNHNQDNPSVLGWRTPFQTLNCTSPRQFFPLSFVIMLNLNR